MKSLGFAYEPADVFQQKKTHIICVYCILMFWQQKAYLIPNNT